MRFIAVLLCLLFVPWAVNAQEKALSADTKLAIREAERPVTNLGAQVSITVERGNALNAELANIRKDYQSLQAQLAEATKKLDAAIDKAYAEAGKTREKSEFILDTLTFKDKPEPPKKPEPGASPPTTQ